MDHPWILESSCSLKTIHFCKKTVAKKNWNLRIFDLKKSFEAFDQSDGNLIVTPFTALSISSKRDYELGNNEKYTDEFFHKIFEINTLKCWLQIEISWWEIFCIWCLEQWLTWIKNLKAKNLSPIEHYVYFNVKGSLHFDGVIKYTIHQKSYHSRSCERYKPILMNFGLFSIFTLRFRKSSFGIV